MNSSKEAGTTDRKDNRLMSALTGLRDWVDARLPVVAAWKKHMSQYYAPNNFNFWYFLVFFFTSVGTTACQWNFLTMNYTPSAESAFMIEYIMQDVEYGWLLRYLHSTGASAFFIVVYLHMFRGCYTAHTRNHVNLSGNWYGIYLVLMAEFHGVCTSMGTNVLLGSECNCFPIRSHSDNWRRFVGMDSRDI